MGLPAGPPGLVPSVEPGKDRFRVFYGHIPDRAIGAAVDFLDDECTPGDISKIGVELSGCIHFYFSLFSFWCISF